MLAALIDRLLHGRDADLMLGKTWMADRLPEYEAYTLRQLDQGRVVKGVEAMRREAFWQARAAKAERRQPWVAQFKRAAR